MSEVVHPSSFKSGTLSVAMTVFFSSAAVMPPRISAEEDVILPTVAARPSFSPAIAPRPAVENTTAAHGGAVVITVVGAAGTDEYGRQFTEWAERWRQAAVQGGGQHISIGGTSASSPTPRDVLRQVLQRQAGAAGANLWLVLIGHGTFDGKTARFNLTGPDVSAAELAEWLEPIPRPVAVINCTSASGPFIERLSAPGRVVITATKSGFEQNFARFGDFLSEAIMNPDADLDGDARTSLLEAFLTAAHRTQAFYETEGRLVTEHALLEDTGDGLAARPDMFRGSRPIHSPPGGAAMDGYRAHQWHLAPNPAERNLTAAERRRRDELELAVVRLRERKLSLEEDEYFMRLEHLLLELAAFYQEEPAAVQAVSGSAIR